MADSNQSRALPVSRRSVLGAVGATVGGGIVGAVEPVDTDGEFVLRQGGQCVPVTPLSGNESVEEFYDYRLPDRFVSAENGGSAAGESDSTYSSNGTEDLQRDDTSIAFLYDGPEGLSLVVVHGSTSHSPNGGGAVTFDVEGLPADGEWVVKDDLYRDASGDLAGTNYDRWHLDGETHRIEWTWAASGTDGGAFRGLSADANVTISPSFNGESRLFGEHYQGTVEAWEFLTPDGSGGVERVSLDMTTPVTVASGSCDGVTGGDGDGDGEPVAEVDEVEFKGCGQARIVFTDDLEQPTTATVVTSNGDREVGIAPSDLTTIPGQHGNSPVYKARGPGKVQAVVIDGDRYENDNECAENGRGNDDKDDDDHHEAEDDDHDDDDDGRGKGNGNGKGKGKDNGDGPPDHAGPSGDDDDDDDDDEEEHEHEEEDEDEEDEDEEDDEEDDD